MSGYRITGGSVGTQILFTVREWPVGTPPTPGNIAPVLNIAAATNLRLILIPPPGVLTQGASQLIATATFYTDGSDGILRYITVAGDIPEIPFGGRPQFWHVRPQFTLGGWSGKGEPDTFTVDP